MIINVTSVLISPHPKSKLRNQLIIINLKPFGGGNRSKIMDEKEEVAEQKRQAKMQEKYFQSEQKRTCLEYAIKANTTRSIGASILITEAEIIEKYLKA